MTAPSLVTAPSRARASTPAEREALYQELLLEIDLGVQGISVDPAELAKFGVGSQITEQRHLLFDMNK